MYSQAILLTDRRLKVKERGAFVGTGRYIYIGIFGKRQLPMIRRTPEAVIEVEGLTFSTVCLLMKMRGRAFVGDDRWISLENQNLFFDLLSWQI